MKLKLRNNPTIKLKVLQWVVVNGVVLAICVDKNGQVDTHGIDDLVGEENFNDVV